MRLEKCNIHISVTCIHEAQFNSWWTSSLQQYWMWGKVICNTKWCPQFQPQCLCENIFRSTLHSARYQIYTKTLIRKVEIQEGNKKYACTVRTCFSLLHAWYKKNSGRLQLVRTPRTKFSATTSIQYGVATLKQGELRIRSCIVAKLT
jgi:hypothetical protein